MDFKDKKKISSPNSMFRYIDALSKIYQYQEKFEDTKGVGQGQHYRWNLVSTEKFILHMQIPF